MIRTTSLIEALPALPSVDYTEFGEVELQPMSKLRQLGAGVLARNWLTIPHVTHHDELDVTLLQEWRSEYNADVRHPKLNLLPFLIAATARTLREFPRFNAALDASRNSLVLKKFYHIGVAVDTADGLLVPVIRDCDKKSVERIADEVKESADKARTKGLALREMSGGCITISSLGHIGGTGFTPIINAPEVAIIGVCPVQSKPYGALVGAIAWRDLLPVSLSYDHRVINGAEAARFTVALGKHLAAPELRGDLSTQNLS